MIGHSHTFGPRLQNELQRLELINHSHDCPCGAPLAKGLNPGPGVCCFRRLCVHACKPRAPGAGRGAHSPSLCTRRPASCLGCTMSPAPTPRGTRLLPSAGRPTGLGEGGVCRLTGHRSWGAGL